MISRGSQGLSRIFMRRRSISIWAPLNALLHGFVLKGALLIGLTCQSATYAEPFSLDVALQRALDRSPTILTARNNLEISRRNLLAQRAALRSQFSLTLTPLQLSRDRVFNDLVSSYNTQEQTQAGGLFSIRQPVEWSDGTLSLNQSLNWREASSSFAGAGKRTTYSSSLQLQYSQPLFTYNRTRLNLRQLELDLENARLSYAVQRLQIESDVTRQYLDLYYRQRNVGISAEELRNATESLEIIQSKVEAGITAAEEFYQADLTRANSQATLENVQMQYANARDTFCLLLGLPFDFRFDVDADVRPEMIDVDLQEAVAHGIEHRMEIRQSDLAVRNSMAEVIRTQALNEFRGSVDVTFGLIGAEEAAADVYSSPTRNQGVSVRLNVPLFDWGESEHRVAAAQQQVERSELSATEERRRITAEIRQAHRALVNQKTQIDIATKSVDNARRTYEINLERYRNGDLPSKDIAFYQTQLSREQLNEVFARINYELALLDLKVRTLYDFSRGEPLAPAVDGD